MFHQLSFSCFLSLDVHHWMLRGIAAQFRIPSARVRCRGERGLSAELLHGAAGGIWLAGLQIAAPVLAATLLCDVTLGFLGKASPQMPVLCFSGWRSKACWEWDATRSPLLAGDVCALLYRVNWIE